MVELRELKRGATTDKTKEDRIETDGLSVNVENP